MGVVDFMTPTMEDHLLMLGFNQMDLDQEDTAGLSQDQKKLRLQSSMRMLKDEPVPEGYSRFR